MNYILAISKSMLDNATDNHSKPIVISAIRDLFLLLESQLINQSMVRTSSNTELEIEPENVNDLMSSLKDTKRDIQDIFKSIEYLQSNITQPTSEKSQYEVAQKAAMRLAQLRDEAVIVKDYTLANEIDNLFENVLK